MKDSSLIPLSVAFDKLKKELSNDTNQQKYRYILLDRLGVVSELSLIYSEELEENFPSDRLAVLKRPTLLHELHSCPLLVCIAAPNEPLNRELLAAAIVQIDDEFLNKKQYVSGFIASPLPPKELAEALVESCLRAGKALNTNYLPFYEPFILDLIRHSYIEPNSHLGLLLPTDSNYYFVDMDYQLYAFHSISYQDEWEFVLNFTNESLRYNHLNKPQLYQIAVTLSDLYEEKEKPLPPKILSKIIHYFYDPQGKQLKNANDRRAYVLFSIIYGQLTENEQLAEIINQVINNEEKQGQLGKLLSQEEHALTSIKSKALNNN